MPANSPLHLISPPYPPHAHGYLQASTSIVLSISLSPLAMHRRQRPLADKSAAYPPPSQWNSIIAIIGLCQRIRKDQNREIHFYQVEHPLAYESAASPQPL
ncbi:hypothetical protein MRB53_033153 [Persea americana]|uniref:Uncharacterized protein n=1 Tax=Persea americana TaxID=3435 RepID=A0ACC2KUH0_PERAE|nr:hypothetical protein MRB53_033153 [Persea americana]